MFEETLFIKFDERHLANRHALGFILLFKSGKIKKKS